MICCQLGLAQLFCNFLILLILSIYFYLGVKISVGNFIPHPSQNQNMSYALSSSPSSDGTGTVGTVHTADSTSSMVISRVSGSNSRRNSFMSRDMEVERNRRRIEREERNGREERYGRGRGERDERKERNGPYDDSTVHSESTQVQKRKQLSTSIM